MCYNIYRDVMKLIWEYLEKYDGTENANLMQKYDILVYCSYTNTNTNTVTKTVFSYDISNNMYYEKTVGNKIVENVYFTLSRQSIFMIYDFLNYVAPTIDFNKIESDDQYEIGEFHIGLLSKNKAISLDVKGLSYSNKCNNETKLLIDFFKGIKQILAKHRISNKYLAI